MCRFDQFPLIPFTELRFLSIAVSAPLGSIGLAKVTRLTMNALVAKRAEILFDSFYEGNSGIRGGTGLLLSLYNGKRFHSPMSTASAGVHDGRHHREIALLTTSHRSRQPRATASRQ